MIDKGLALRIAGSGDVDAIAALARRAYQKWVPVLGRTPSPMIADYGEMMKSHRIDLHEIDGELIASLATRVESGYLFIESVAVDPAWQGKGIGRMLLAHAEDLAKRNSVAEIRLLTNALMEANAALYRRVGYVLFETETHPAYGGVLHFRKVLA